MKEEMKVSGEEVEVVAYMDHHDALSHNAPRTAHFALMTVAQHQRITDALRERLDVMNQCADNYSRMFEESAEECDQLRAEVERLKAQLAEEIQRRFDGNEISSNEHREEVQRLQAQLAQQQMPGWKLVPVEPTPEMVSAAEEAHMPFGDMDIALRMAILSAPSAPATVQGVNTQLLEALEKTAAWIEQLPVPTVGAAGQLVKIDKAIAAARKGEQ